MIAHTDGLHKHSVAALYFENNCQGYAVKRAPSRFVVELQQAQSYSAMQSTQHQRIYLQLLDQANGEQCGKEIMLMWDWRLLAKDPNRHMRKGCTNTVKPL